MIILRTTIKYSNVNKAIKSMVIIIIIMIIIIIIIIMIIIITKIIKKASVRRCFTKKLFLKVLQNSQESTCVGITF